MDLTLLTLIFRIRDRAMATSGPLGLSQFYNPEAQLRVKV